MTLLTRAVETIVPPCTWRKQQTVRQRVRDHRRRVMPQEVTKDLLEKIDAEFDAAKTPEDVRAVFKRYYSDLGWKRLCRLFVLQYGVDELWLAEEERAKKSGPKDE
jgi:hypothetical protein